MGKRLAIIRRQDGSMESAKRIGGIRALLPYEVKLCESLGITARGNLNLDKNSINMTGSVAPIKLISKILSVVPAVGQLLTGLKKEGLFAGQFEMQGEIENPEIKLNTMSFAPGILRELFSEDWLDNKNFFINKAID